MVPWVGVEVPKLTFDFVDDAALARVLDEYYGQTTKAAAAESSLGVLVGCGSVVEGLLAWALLQKRDEALTSKKAPKDMQGEVRPIREWNLAKLIDVSVELGLVGETAKSASWAVKDFRNFIHPYNVLQQSARPNKTLAMNALSALEEICRSLKGRLS